MYILKHSLEQRQQRLYGLQSQKYLLSDLNRKAYLLLIYLRTPEGSKISVRGEILRENLRDLSCHWGWVLILDEGERLRTKVWPGQRKQQRFQWPHGTEETQLEI